jgi:tRNA-dihydrouridine synthase B
MLADAARYNVDQGAQIIDINMGCPAKKVCNVMAGSALLKDEPLVARILEAVVRAVEVPVTLKIRTGWDRANRNALGVARIAEQSGIRRWPSTAAPAPAGFPARRSTTRSPR